MLHSPPPCEAPPPANLPGPETADLLRMGGKQGRQEVQEGVRGGLLDCQKINQK